MNDVFVARQPIFDLKQNVFGYEIFYRGSEINAFDNTAEDKATARALLNTFLLFGLENLTNNKPAFVNFGQGFLADDIPELFPDDKLVVEILESVEPCEDVLDKCRQLREKGFTIALDDFVTRPGYDVLLSEVDIIKLDFCALDRAALKQIVRRYRVRPNLTFLAEKVETEADLEFAREIGCTLFQGYYFGHPVIHRTKSFNSLDTTYLTLLNAVNKEDLDFGEITRIILRDMSLTYYLLKLVNSPVFGLANRVTSVRQALVVLGEKEIKKWFALIVFSIIGTDIPDELIQVSLLRARLAELLSTGSNVGGSSEHYFLGGLFSMLDTILNRSFAQIVDEIFLPESVRKYLLNQNSYILPVMDLVLAYEKGEWEQVIELAKRLELRQNDLAEAYRKALIWQQRLRSN